MLRLLAAIGLIGMVAAGLSPASAESGGGVQVDPNFPPLGGSSPGGIGALPTRPPTYQAPPPSSGAVINCDPYGRCWRQVPRYGSGSTRPPGWADDAPVRSRDPYRFNRPQSGVVCDRRTNVCYKNGRLDRSETKAAFGDRAADNVERVRDRNRTGRLFLPERGVTCNTAQQICYDNGVADFSQTRRYFGDRAAGALD